MILINKLNTAKLRWCIVLDLQDSQNVFRPLATCYQNFNCHARWIQV